MKTKNSNTSDNKKQGHSHTRHMKMMEIYVALLWSAHQRIYRYWHIRHQYAITGNPASCDLPRRHDRHDVYDESDSQGKEKGHSCCQSEESEDESVTGISHDDAENAKPGPTKPQQPGSLEA